MNIKITIKGLAMVAFMSATALFAQQDTAKKVDAPLTISGQVDAYYRASSLKKSGQAKTSYTDQNNAFGLGMVNIVLAKDNGKVGFVADMIFGTRAEQTNYYYKGSSAFVKQLFVTYKPSDKIKFTLGNFMTFVGYELVEASNNLNYSMSYNYTNGPFFHTGLKADIAFTDKFAGMIGIFNQTDTKGRANLIDDALDVSKKMVGGQLSYISGPFKIYVNGLSGKGGDNTLSTTFDVTTSYQVTEKFGAGFNFITQLLTKESKTNSWNGSALYLNYAFAPSFTLAVRGELFNDKNGLKYYNGDGITLGDGKPVLDNAITAFTLSGNFKIDAFTIIPEIRFDSGKKAFWYDSAKKAQSGETSFILAGVYKF